MFLNLSGKNFNFIQIFQYQSFCCVATELNQNGHWNLITDSSLTESEDYLFLPLPLPHSAQTEAAYRNLCLQHSFQQLCSHHFLGLCKNKIITVRFSALFLPYSIHWIFYSFLHWFHFWRYKPQLCLDVFTHNLCQTVFWTFILTHWKFVVNNLQNIQFPIGQLCLNVLFNFFFNFWNGLLLSLSN